MTTRTDRRHPGPRDRGIRLVTLLTTSVLTLGLALTSQPAAASGTIGEIEPNASTAQAQALPLDTTVDASFRKTGDCDNTFYDCDVYAISAPSAGRLVLDLRFASTLGTEGSFALTVTNAAGARTYSHDVSVADYDGSSLRNLAMYVDSGTSYITLKARVSGFGSGYIWSGQGYTLTASVRKGVVETEPNGKTSTADELVLGRTVTGSSFSGDCDNNFYDCDFYRVPLGAATPLVVDLRFPCGLGTSTIYTLRVLSGSGAQLSVKTLGGGDCDGTASRSTTVTAPAGNAYVSVSSRVGSVAKGRPYSLTVVPAADFVDVSGTAGPTFSPFVTEISWMAQKGISTGTLRADGSREYQPAGNVTRDAMAAFLYRHAGSPAFSAPATSPFVDVSPSHPFYREITWLAAKGISTGWDTPGGKEFRPSLAITRDAMAAFLFRYAAPLRYGAPTTPPFADIAPDAPFYRETSWLAERGVSTGWPTGDGRIEFRPSLAITRDAMAAFLFRYTNSA